MTREETIRSLGAKVGLNEKWLAQAIRWRDPRGCLDCHPRDWPLLDPVEAVQCALERQALHHASLDADLLALPSPTTKWDKAIAAVHVEFGITSPGRAR